MRLGKQVVSIRGRAGGYELISHDGGVVTVDAVVFATPANVTARILQDESPYSAEQLSAINHTNLGTISLIYRSQDLTDVMPFSGIMIPRREGRRIDAVTWSSRKDRERTPAGYDVLRVFFGGGDPATATLPEQDLLGVVCTELHDLLGIQARPQHHFVARWVDEYARAYVGHLTRVEAIEQDLPDGCFVTGASYRGLAVPDCIHQGRRTAEQVRQYLHKLASPVTPDRG